MSYNSYPFGIPSSSEEAGMTNIDVAQCAKLVQKIADGIASDGPGQAKDSTLQELIADVQTISKSAEQTLRKALADLYPQIGWTSEDERPDKADYWLYDPIDGAYHYLQGLALWASSLVLVRDGLPTISIVYDTALGETFVAARGQGATCNGRSIQVSPKSDLSTTVVGTAIPPLAQVGPAALDEALEMIGAVSKSVFVVRPMAAVSLQLAYVAAGRLDGYFENGRDTADWLAGALLVLEAGGFVTDLDGHSFGWSGHGIVAGNLKIQPSLIKTIETVERAPMAQVA
jgi:myo-inositol-1(or 4)-monophosphatase